MLSLTSITDYDEHTETDSAELSPKRREHICISFLMKNKLFLMKHQLNNANSGVGEPSRSMAV